MSVKGSYSLIIENPDRAKVGALGNVEFRKRYSVYNGSAFGSGGLKRVLRHFSFSGGCHWHIDYLLKTGCLKAALIYPEQDLECSLSNKIGRPFIEGFGCSDCSCESHLFLFDSFEEALSIGSGEVKVLDKSRHDEYVGGECEQTVDDLIRDSPDASSYKKACRVDE